MGCFKNNVIGNRKTCLLRFVLDVTCIILVSVGIFAIKYGSVPYNRGFFCDDESIKHPYLEDTISVPLAVSVGVILPVVVIVFTEFMFRNSKTIAFLSLRSYFMRNRSWATAAYSSVVVFFFGIAITQFLTEIGKYSIGRLRPHFLTVCNPQLGSADCTQYITTDMCTTTEEDKLKEARLSFPSGHSSFSMYCMLYLILYVQARILCKAVLFLKPLFQLILFSMGFFTCLSRISDYKHHWSDVLAGAILGMVVCVCVVFCLSDFGHTLCQTCRYCRHSEDIVDLSLESPVKEGQDRSYNSHSKTSVPSNSSSIVQVEF